jgi:hypothetical protein
MDTFPDGEFFFIPQTPLLTWYSLGMPSIWPLIALQ